MASYDAFLKNLPPLIGLVILVLVLLFVLVNFGYLRACEIPGFSGIYYAIKGTPKVAIVTGNDGTGDPNYLRNTIAQEIHIAPMVIPVDTVFDSSALSSYQIVIVEHAKAMSTQTLWAFQKYVQAGGKLVWIGDAGTELGKNDYICEKVTFSYRPGAIVTTGENQTQEVCGEWQQLSPNSLDNSDDGLCARTFGEIVVDFVNENKSTYETVTTGQYQLCSAENNPYRISNAEKILSCISKLQEEGKSITAANANEVCTTYNYWQRGPSKTAAKEPVSSLDFSNLVLGMDFVRQYGASNIFLTPSGGTHALTKGYETGTSVDFSTFFGVSNISLVDTSRFASVPRTSTVMSMKVENDMYPAIIVSTPYISINRNGLIVYYAFAPDDLIKAGSGVRLVNNLFSFLMC